MQKQTSKQLLDVSAGCGSGELVDDIQSCLVVRVAQVHVDPCLRTNKVRPTLFPNDKRSASSNHKVKWTETSNGHYIEQQPHYFCLAVEGGLMQSGPRFGGSVDVDAGFKQQPGKRNQKRSLRPQANIVHSTAAGVYSIAFKSMCRYSAGRDAEGG